MTTSIFGGYFTVGETPRTQNSARSVLEECLGDYRNLSIQTGGNSRPWETMRWDEMIKAYGQKVGYRIRQTEQELRPLSGSRRAQSSSAIRRCLWLSGTERKRQVKHREDDDRSFVAG